MSSSGAEAEVRSEAWKRFHERYLAPKLAETAADVTNAGDRLLLVIHLHRAHTASSGTFPEIDTQQGQTAEDAGMHIRTK